MKKLLIVALLSSVFAASCGTVNNYVEEKSMNNLEQQAEPSDVAIRELFVESGLGEGDEFLEELQRLPKERVVPIVQEIKDKGIRDGDRDFGQKYADEKLRLKAAYFLWLLGTDRKANEDYLLKSAAGSDKVIRQESVTNLAAIAEKGAFEHLPLIFSEAAAADGEYAEELGVFFAGMFDNTTEPFLRSLAGEPEKNRRAVCKLMVGTHAMDDEESRTEAKTKLEPLTKSPEFKAIASEMTVCLGLGK